MGRLTVFRRPGSPVWHYYFRLGGDRVRGSTGETDQVAARAAAERTRAHLILQQGSATTRPTATLTAALARYWAEKAAALKSESLQAGYARRWLAFLGGDRPLAAIGDVDIARYVAKRRGQTYGRFARRPISGSTINRELAFLGALLNRARATWRFDVGAIDWRAHRLREPEPIDRALSAAEAERLIAAAAPHIQAPVRLALLTGLRRGNVVGLDWSEVRLAEAELRVRVKSTAPGGRPLTVPLSTAALVLLANLGPRRSGPVFTRPGPGGRARPLGSIRRAFADAAKLAGLAGLRFHDLRHTAATWMIERGVALDLVQRVLGHRAITTTQRYAHRRPEALRAAVEALAHPRSGHAAPAPAAQTVDQPR